MTNIAFFAHNSAEPAVRRRAGAFMGAGYQLTGFMMRRGPQEPTPWHNVDLGKTTDNAYLSRVSSIFKGARIAVEAQEKLRKADMLYARNLDMLYCASLAKRRLKLSAPLVYECLDVHQLLTRNDIRAQALRHLESRLLKGCSLLVCSSPGFLREYFAKRHPGAYTPFLIENRLIDGGAFPERKNLRHPPLDSRQPLRLGWFGNLRCARSFELMRSLADKYQGRLGIQLRGYPAQNVFPNFEDDVAQIPGIEYGGPYQAPDDLQAIYAGVDLVWAGDYHEAGANSMWLLPNRIYEGGYFATPPIAPMPTETGRWIEERDAGFTIEEPVEKTLPRLIGELIHDRAPIASKRASLENLPRDVFVEEPGFIIEMVDKALAHATPIAHTINAANSPGPATS